MEQALQYDPNSLVALRGWWVTTSTENSQLQALERINAQSQEPKNSGFYDLMAQVHIQNKTGSG